MAIHQLPIPGFVDLQVNGFRGVDFSSPELTEDALIWACRAILAEGAAAFLPTMISSTVDVYRRNLPLLASAVAREEFKGYVLGIHVEGPFISSEPGARGAHDAGNIQAADLSLLRELLTWAGGQVRLLTVAAEIPGAGDLITCAVDAGVTVSIGHTLATEEDLQLAAKAGATALTHLGNGLPNLLPRHCNPIWAGLANDDLTAMIIADGHHLPASVLRTFIRAKGADSIVVVSDASPLAGMPPGQYTTLGNQVVLEASGRLFSPRKQCLVGSSATMIQCMNHLAALDRLSLDDLLLVGFHNPLRLIGADPAAMPGGAGLVFDDEAGVFSVVA